MPDEAPKDWSIVERPFRRWEDHWALPVIGVISAFAMIILLGFLQHAKAQDGDRNYRHLENHDWYRDLRQPGTGYSCCNGTANGVDGDCRQTRAYLDGYGQWHAIVNGVWRAVPIRTILKDMAPDGNSHVCASKSGVIYCFLRGSPKS